MKPFDTAYCPQVVFITGATGGLGEAFARKFATLGCRLVLTGRNQQHLKTLAGISPSTIHTFSLDIRDHQALNNQLEKLPPEFQAIDVLINNAGLALGLDPAQDATWDDWETMIDTNVKALAACTHAILPGMLKRNRGHIINISSVAGSYPYPKGHVYCASKAFVTQFSLALRSDLIATPVRVTSLEPGMVETNFSMVRFKGDKERAQKVYANTAPLLPEDVANAAVWVATQPPHVSISRLEIMPTAQSLGPFAVHRTS